jgi:hypothetical protein
MRTLYVKNTRAPRRFAGLLLEFLAEGAMKPIKRVTIIAKDGKIVEHFCPVFPPDGYIGCACVAARWDNYIEQTARKPRSHGFF